MLLYKALCSKYKTGLGSANAAINNPFASVGLEGYTTFKPATCVNQASLDCE